MQLPAAEDKIYSAAYAAARYLKQQGHADVFCFGTAGLHQELTALTVGTVSSPEQAAVVLIGLDKSINYERISSLLPLRNKNCTLVACNRDKFFPSDNGVHQLRVRIHRSIG
jgi:4-nitrophenyl phosphatase